MGGGRRRGRETNKGQSMKRKNMREIENLTKKEEVCNSYLASYVVLNVNKDIDIEVGKSSQTLSDLSHFFLTFL